MSSLLRTKKKIPFFIFILAFLTGLWMLSSSENQKATLTPYPFPELVAFPKMPENPDNPVSVEGAELGRYLFYDPILSKDKTISCATCHKQENAFSDSPNTFSKGIDGALQKRNTPPLFNLAWYPAFFWDGRATTLEEQVFFPVRDHAEMNLDWKIAEDRLNKSKFYRKKFYDVFLINTIDSIHIAKAIAQFERTLISNNSKFDRVLRREDKLTSAEFRGFEIVNDQSMADCLHCHTTDAHALGTSRKFSNNGLDTASTIYGYLDPGKGAISSLSKEYGTFKIPSIRNVAVTAPYMHDGRFKTLREVIDFYSEGLHPSVNIDPKMTRITTRGVQLSESDKICLEEFLHTLTDSVFLTNPEFSNPFRKRK